MVDLKQECEEALAARLSSDSVGATLLLADKHNCSGLKEKCEQLRRDDEGRISGSRVSFVGAAKMDAGGAGLCAW